MAHTLTPDDVGAVRDAIMAVLAPRIDAIDRQLDQGFADMGSRLARLETRLDVLEARVGRLVTI